MAISSRMQMEVFTRDGFSCVYCGDQPGASRLEVDHLVPRSKRGSDNKLNLVAACAKCNRLKGNKFYVPKALGLPEDDEGYALLLSNGVWGIKIGSTGLFLCGAVYGTNDLTKTFDCWEINVARIDSHIHDHISGKTWQRPHSIVDFSVTLDLAQSMMNDF